jgi:hypothetical protein
LEQLQNFITANKPGNCKCYAEHHFS